MVFLKNLQNHLRISETGPKVILASITVFLFIFTSYPFFSATKSVEIVKVVDGDTVDVRSETKQHTVRLKGVDTPETQGYNNPEEFKGVSNQNWKCLEDWGYKAKDYVKRKIAGKKVSLSYRKGVLTVEKGAFNRMIGKIYIEDSNISLNKALVKKGYARSYDDHYIDIERKARQNNTGLWQCRE